MYRPMVAIDVTAAYATLLHRCHKRCPGTAPSRLKANSILEFAVTDAMPQKPWATTAMIKRSSAPTRDRAEVQIATGAVAWPATVV